MQRMRKLIHAPVELLVSEARAMKLGGGPVRHPVRSRLKEFVERLSRDRYSVRNMLFVARQPGSRGFWTGFHSLISPHESPIFSPYKTLDGPIYCGMPLQLHLMF